RGIGLVFLLLYASVFLAASLSMKNGPLGRYLKEGELTFSEKKIITTNTFSYTEPGRKVNNHEWGLAVFYYFLYKNLGFEGLHIILALGYLLLLAWTFRWLLKKYNPAWTFAILLTAIPLLLKEPVTSPGHIMWITPLLFFNLTERFRNDNIRSAWLWLLPFFQ